MSRWLPPTLPPAGSLMPGRVIKIERPEGDFARQYDALVKGEIAYFVWLNRGKEWICLDLKREDHLSLLKAMIARADVFIQNLAPGAAARLGLAAKILTTRYRRLIYCSVSGYGEDGPTRDHKAYDLLVQGESGLLGNVTTPSGEIERLTAGVRVAEATIEPLGSVPSLGEHTEALRREFASAVERAAN